ncbi:MAG: 16S rRNA (cytosine(967)-C(5))-methyltransferase RsmB [Oscillospiraceae bacterium]
MKRKLVVDGLIKMENSGFSNLVFSSILDSSQLTAQDKSFAAKMFYGSIERKLTLNYILQKFITKPLEKIDKEVLAILQSGLYQIKYMDAVPSHAAINQAVSLCPVFKKTSAKGLVNAVLRKAAAVELEKETFQNETQRLSVIYSISEEILKVIMRDYPQNFEEILQGMFTLPKLTIKVNTTKTSAEELKQLFDKKKVTYLETPLEDSLELKYRGAVTSIPGFREGLFFIQGITSQYAVLAAGIKENDRVLDLCAAPGGKSFSAAIALKNTGFVTSCDPNPARFSLIEDGASRLGLTNITIVQNYGEEYNELLADQDVVLCDVPCSGVGVIPKKPDLRYKPLENLEKLCKLQYDILSTASKYVKAKGRLVYSTCTINRQENEGVVDKFLKENSNFQLIKQACPIPNAVNDGEKITFLSHLTGFDGFFVAVMEKMW